jgi:two-component system, cell cycle sensor histidine kinase and response regulator CckA
LIQNPLRVLLVEDDDEDALIARDMLSEIHEQEFSLEWVTSYDAGLEAMLSGEHDVCLLDYRLGAHDGVDLLRTAQARGAALPIVLFTGNGNRRADLAAMRAGAADFLVKGHTNAALLERSLRYAVTHHRALEALRLFRAAVEAASESIVITTAELDHPGPTIVYANPAFTAMTGYGLEEVLGQNPRFLQGPGTDREALTALRETLRRGERFFCETINYRKDGSEFRIAFHVGPVRDRVGNVTHYVSLQEDVTEQRHTEDERTRLEEGLRQAQKMEAIGRLAGGVAHDFNNVLTGILGYNSRLLERLPEPDPRREYALEIEQAGQRAAGLTRQLLAFGRKQVLEPRALDLNELVEGMVGLLRALVEDDVSIETSLSPAMGRVWADPVQLEQVILNLAVNSRDAMPRGGTITIATADADPEACARVGLGTLPHVILAFRDNGQGMDAQTRARAFEPFFTTKDVGKGTGLGLSTVQGIVAQTGGRVFLYSKPGAGTSVEIFLPTTDRAAVPQIGRLERVAVAESRAETVLLVEDDDGLRALSVLALEEAGYSVLEAASGTAAIGLAEAHEGPIHLLVTDVAMPQMRGDELAQQLVARRPETRVLYLSGYVGDVLVERGFAGQGEKLLEKPFFPEDLLREVRSLLD